MFWQRPTFIAKFQSLPRQISQLRGHFENRLEKNEKTRIPSNKCDICTLDIMIDFHWKNEANWWRSEICLIRSYADSLSNMISKNEKSQSMNNNQIGVEFHEQGNKIMLTEFSWLSLWLMIHGTRESKILGGGGCFVWFSYSVYVTYPCLPSF